MQSRQGLLSKLSQPIDFNYYRDLTQIRRNVFLGSLSGLNNESHVQELGITHVVNCTGDVAFPNHRLIPQQNMHRFNIAAQRSQMYCRDKSDSSDPNGLVKQMLMFVQRAVDSGGKVAFYCIAGCHRAPGTCQLYLMYEAATRGQAMEPTVAFVETQTKRVQAEFCYENLLQSLKEWVQTNAKQIQAQSRRVV